MRQFGTMSISGFDIPVFTCGKALNGARQMEKVILQRQYTTILWVSCAGYVDVNTPEGVTNLFINIDFAGDWESCALRIGQGVNQFLRLLEIMDEISCVIFCCNYRADRSPISLSCFMGILSGNKDTCVEFHRKVVAVDSTVRVIALPIAVHVDERIGIGHNTRDSPLIMDLLTGRGLCDLPEVAEYADPSRWFPNGFPSYDDNDGSGA